MEKFIQALRDRERVKTIVRRQHGAERSQIHDWTLLTLSKIYSINGDREPDGVVAGDGPRDAHLAARTCCMNSLRLDDVALGCLQPAHTHKRYSDSEQERAAQHRSTQPTSYVQSSSQCG